MDGLNNIEIAVTEIIEKLNAAEENYVKLFTVKERQEKILQDKKDRFVAQELEAARQFEENREHREKEQKERAREFAEEKELYSSIEDSDDPTHNIMRRVFEKLWWRDHD